VVEVVEEVDDVDDRTVASVSPAGRAELVDDPPEHPAIRTVMTTTAAGTRQRDMWVLLWVRPHSAQGKPHGTGRSAANARRVRVVTQRRNPTVAADVHGAEGRCPTRR
jgi:hypothetical protein